MTEKRYLKCTLITVRNPTPFGVGFRTDGRAGFERPLRKHAGGVFLDRGRIHSLMNAPGTGVGIRLFGRSIVRWSKYL